jgi:hypothetical protein
MQLKELEKQEKHKLKIRRKEITKIRVKINENRDENTIQNVNETKSFSLKVKKLTRF